MPLYEKRTYQVAIGKMPDVVALETDIVAVLEAEGFAQHLVGYFISDTGPLHQLIHIWRFDDDQARRDFWKRIYASEAFMALAVQIRPLLEGQEVQLMTNAPFGPTP